MPSGGFKGGASRADTPSPALLGALGVGLCAALSPAARAWPDAVADAQPSACGLALLVGASAVSAVLRDRLLAAPRNLLGHPLRSLLEWALCGAAALVIHRALDHWSTRALSSALAAALVLHASAELSALRARLALASQYRTFDLSRASFFADGTPLAPSTLRCVPLAELRAHSSAEDCWIAIDGAVLDVSAWAKQHPGTALVITSLAGMDASDQYKAFHGYAMGARLRAMAVGRLDDATAEPPSLAQVVFRALHERLRARGEFAYPLGRTVLPMVRPLVLMAFAIAALLASARGLALAGASSTTLAALAGGLAGLAWQQMSLFGHDLGHGNVTGSYAHDLAMGLVLLPFFGIGACRRRDTSRPRATGAARARRAVPPNSLARATRSRLTRARLARSRAMERRSELVEGEPQHAPRGHQLAHARPGHPVPSDLCDHAENAFWVLFILSPQDVWLRQGSQGAVRGAALALLPDHGRRQG
jgi:cytochrome b involved in lipid metabolism